MQLTWKRILHFSLKEPCSKTARPHTNSSKLILPFCSGRGKGRGQQDVTHWRNHSHIYHQMQHLLLVEGIEEAMSVI